MNRLIRIIIFLIAVGAHVPDANAEDAKKDTISILSFNDFHGAFISGQGTPGAGNFVAALLELKKSVPNPEIRELVDSIGRAKQFDEVYVKVTEDLIHDRFRQLYAATGGNNYP